MTELLRVFSSPTELMGDPIGFKNPAGDLLGFVYMFEIGSEKIKIGSTGKPIRRLGEWLRSAEAFDKKIGRIAVTPAHLNYKENELFLHSKFPKARCGNCEYFSIKLDNAVAEAEQMNLRIPSIQEMDNIRFQAERRAMALAEMISRAGCPTKRSDTAIPWSDMLRKNFDGVVELSDEFVSSSSHALDHLYDDRVSHEWICRMYSEAIFASMQNQWVEGPIL